MGTNYYWHQKEDCKCCGRPFEPVHIGKSSFGWTFTFHAVDEIKSYKAWKEALKSGGFIRDEYGSTMLLADFVDLVESKKKEKMNHAIESRKERWGGNNFLDAEGNSFSDYEFS